MHSQACDAADCSDHGVRAQERKPRMISFPGNCCRDATCRRHPAGAARLPCKRSGAWVCRFHRLRRRFRFRCAGRAGRPRGRDDGGAAPRADVGRSFRGRPSRRALRRALRTRTCHAAKSQTLMARARQGRAFRTMNSRRIVRHVRWSRCERVTRASRQDRCQADQLGRGQQPISLSRAAPCYRMRIHGRCRPNRRVHHCANGATPAALNSHGVKGAMGHRSWR